MSTSFRLPAVSTAGGPPSMGRPNRWSAGHPLAVASEWGPASVGGGGRGGRGGGGRRSGDPNVGPGGRRSGDPNAGLDAAGECGWGGAAVPPASTDAGALALQLPSTAAMGWGEDDAPADAADDDGDFDIGMTRTVAAECLSPEMAAHLSTASDYLFAKRTRQVRFSSSQLSLERPDLSLRPLGRCAWADVLLPLHNGLRVVRRRELLVPFHGFPFLLCRGGMARSALFFFGKPALMTTFSHGCPPGGLFFSVPSVLLGVSVVCCPRASSFSVTAPPRRS